MKTLERILLVEDNLRDVELTLAALEEHRLANEIVVARDGAEALDYLHGRGKYAGRDSTAGGAESRPAYFPRPRWSCSTSRCRNSMGSRCSGR